MVVELTIRSVGPGGIYVFVNGPLDVTTGEYIQSYFVMNVVVSGKLALNMVLSYCMIVLVNWVPVVFLGSGDGFIKNNPAFGSLVGRGHDVTQFTTMTTALYRTLIALGLQGVGDLGFVLLVDKNLTLTVLEGLAFLGRVSNFNSVILRGEYGSVCSSVEFLRLSPH